MTAGAGTVGVVDGVTVAAAIGKAYATIAGRLGCRRMDVRAKGAHGARYQNADQNESEHRSRVIIGGSCMGGMQGVCVQPETDDIRRLWRNLLRPGIRLAPSSSIEVSDLVTLGPGHPS